ncbi:MAG TPA: hypothetical protein VFQ67_00070 [Allosphingosinicella sp.]|jgi:hypothetical protein|nr:hypothetical protein [Allosphingosinicella sp.]
MYLFRSHVFAHNRDSVVCVGPTAEIEALLGRGFVQAEFGGAVFYRDDRERELIGVWGRRKASRLRRLLREKGAEIVVHRASPDADLYLWSTR